MSKRALIRQADLTRLLRAAKAEGFAVEFQGDKVRLLPKEGGAVVPSESGLAPAEKALAKWRRSA